MWLVDVQVALEVRELRPSKAMRRRTELLDPPVCDTCEIRRCSLERFERDATRLVWE